MAKARSQKTASGQKINPRELQLLARAGRLVAAVLVVVWLLQLAGLTGRLDQRVHGLWFELGERVGATSKSSQKVHLIVGDAGTIEKWGPPPWDASRLELLIEATTKGASDPLLFVEVGHQRMFQLDEADLAHLRERFPEVRLLLRVGEDAPSSPWSEGGLRDGALPVSKGGRLAKIIDSSGSMFPPVHDRLYVQWMMPDSSLPRLSASVLVSDDHMERNFANQLLLMGVTDPQFAIPIDTPVGPLSPAEIEAHALRALADGQVAEPPSPVLVYVLWGLFAFALLWALERMRGKKAALMLFALVVVLASLDGVLLLRGVTRLGISRPLLIMALTTAGYWQGQAVQAFERLRALRARVLREASEKRDLDRPEDDGFWDDLAEIGAEYAQGIVGGAAASTIMERQPDRWNLQVWASAKLDADSHKYLAEREALDLRRAPFRAAWLTLRASWTRDLLPSGARFGERKTLIVPLENRGELLGLWLIHVLIEVEIGPDDVEVFENLGRQMAGAVLRRRERSALRSQSARTRLRDHLDTIVGGLRLITDEHRWALEFLGQLPVRAIIATVWGEVEFVDPQLKKQLSQRYPGLFSADKPDDNLRTVLARITGGSLEDANRLMRKVAKGGDAKLVELEQAPGSGLDGAEGDDVVWVLSLIHSKEGIDLPGFKPAVTEHILLMARSSAPAKTIRTDSGRTLRVLSGFGG